MEKYRPLSWYLRDSAFPIVVMTMIGLCFGGVMLHDALTRGRSVIEGRLTVERCDSDVEPTRCTGTFRAHKGGFEKSGVVREDTSPDLEWIEGWIEGRDGTELLSDTADDWRHRDHRESPLWGMNWKLQTFLAGFMIVLGAGIGISVAVLNWRDQPARRGRRGH